jgi:hypothetical protein
MALVVAVGGGVEGGFFFLSVCVVKFVAAACGVQPATEVFFVLSNLD